MSLLQRFWERRSQQFSTLANPTDWLFDALGRNRSASGRSVTPDTALQTSAVFACVRVLAGSLATLPLITYRRLPDGGKDRAVDHPVYRLLHDAPNAYQTAVEFREMLQGHVMLRGNAFAEIEFTRGGFPVALWPRHPDWVQVYVTPDGLPAYYITPRPPIKGEPYWLLGDEILHLRGLSSNGFIGLSPVALAQEAIGTALAAEEHAARFFSNNAAPGGIVKHPGKLSKDAYERLKTAWQARHEGGENAHKTAILEEGMDWVTVGMTSKDAQFLETRHYQVADIARIFGVQPWMIGSSDGSTMTYSNTEQQSLAFVTYSLRPWLVRWEQALARVLLTEKEQATYSIEHLVDALLRGDALARSQSLAVQRTGGVLTANEWRAIENRNPIAGGDVLLDPQNLRLPRAPVAPDAAPAAPDPMLGPNAGRARQALREVAATVLRDAFTRCEARRARQGGEKGQADYMARALAPGLQAYVAGVVALEACAAPTEGVLRAILQGSIERSLLELRAGTLEVEGTVAALLAVADSWLTDTGARAAA